MKIAYLMQVRENIIQAAHTITALSTYDDVFVTCFDFDEGRPLAKQFQDNSNVHFINENYEFMEGSLSIPRVWLLLLHNALSFGPYGAYINISEYTLPIISRDDLEKELLDSRDYDMIQYTSEKQVPNLRDNYQKFSIGPSDPRYSKDEKFRKRMLKLSSFVYSIHVRRKKIPFELYQGPCWFVLSHDTAVKIDENMEECSSNFNLSFFSQEVYFQSAINKYSDKIINKCVVLLDRAWEPKFFSKTVSNQQLEDNDSKYFAYMVKREDNQEIYDKYIEQY
jgi:hypothetical protein